MIALWRTFVLLLLYTELFTVKMIVGDGALDVPVCDQK